MRGIGGGGCSPTPLDFWENGLFWAQEVNFWVLLTFPKVANLPKSCKQPKIFRAAQFLVNCTLSALNKILTHSHPTS